MKEWDVFVSHASEDKAEVALPLTLALQQAGVRVWLDKFEIRIGDSIRRKIDEGLAGSRFGVVIVSDAFFAKQWAGDELDALFAGKTILPVWHRMTKEQVGAKSPLMAARRAANTAMGMEVVAEEIAERIFQSSGGQSPSAARGLAMLLTRHAPLAEIRSFSSENPVIFERALRVHALDYARSGVSLDEHRVDFCTSVFQRSTNRHERWKLVLLGDPQLKLGPASDDEVGALLRTFEAIRAETARHRKVLPSLRSDFRAIVVAGRRPQPGTQEAEWLVRTNDGLAGKSSVRTYDWLLDAALEPG